MLVELSVMEQRYQAVMAVVQDGWKVKEVARKLGTLSRELDSIAEIRAFAQGLTEAAYALADMLTAPANAEGTSVWKTPAALLDLR